MSEEKNIQVQEVEEEQSSFNFAAIYRIVILYWGWFVASVLICLGLAYVYLRYTKPVYSTFAKIMIKEDDGSGRRRSSSALDMTNLGTLANSYGIENEQEILTSNTIAAQAVRDLKLYVAYEKDGRVTNSILYKDQPITVDVDPAHLEKLNSPISLTITRDGNAYKVKGQYRVPVDELTSKGPYAFERSITKFPVAIRTNAGLITFNSTGRVLGDGQTMYVTILSPVMAARSYVGRTSINQSNKGTSILRMVFNDMIPQRGVDYLNQLAICYNRQANEDKNEIAVRTEEFINSRLEKINAELGSTDGALESFKRSNRLIELNIDARQSAANSNAYAQKLADANTQIDLINSLVQFANRPGNQYQVLPSNVGLQDGAATALIGEYNRIALERNRLLRSASENSPSVEPLTAQLDELSASINQALTQARRSLEITRDALAHQHGQYASEISRTPLQERILTQIGRQQEVKSGLYLMLLQKREENSINLAATADKAKLIELPQFAGKVSPKNNMIYLIALLIGLLIPSVILFLINFFRYKIEGHDDVVRLTQLPILADVAVASEQAKTKADIVVHANKNNQMEEIFRSMRTNLQFMLKENEKVIMFTSSTSGEGKTFNASNLAVSFALLGKKVVLVGLDIRKPRLAELFEIKNHHNGITPLLAKEEPTWEEVQEQILPSEVNDCLDLLLAGPVPPNPAELMARPSLDIIFKHLTDHYDYVLVDTAPVGLVTDTLQISRVSNATVFVCRADYTPKSSFDMINALSVENKLPNMAMVINGIDMSKRKNSYYYGYGAYGRYGRYGRYSGYGYGHKKYGYGYGRYGQYGTYGNYGKSNYGTKNDNSVKL